MAVSHYCVTADSPHDHTHPYLILTPPTQIQKGERHFDIIFMIGRTALERVRVTTFSLLLCFEEASKMVKTITTSK